MADGAISIEEVLKGIIGQPTDKAKVVVERGPVTHFADAVLSTSPIYRNPEAAKEAGFAAIPAPPTLPFAMEFSGKFDEIQPTDAPAGNPLGTAIGPAHGQRRPDPPRRTGVHLPSPGPGRRRA